MQSWRGQLRRHLCWVEPVGDELPAVGAVLRAGARRAGWVGGGYLMPDGEALGLALIQRKPYEPGAELEVEGGGRVRVRATTVPEVWGQ